MRHVGWVCFCVMAWGCVSHKPKWKEVLEAEPAAPPSTAAPVSQASSSARQADERGHDCAHDTTTFRCVTYVKTYDGDTVTFEIPGVHPLLGHAISVRVLGIDTAEMKGKTPCEKARAVEARDLVASILSKAKRVDLLDVGRDKFFRIDAVIVADGVNIGDVLLEHGLAYRYDGGTKAAPDWCRAGEIGGAR